MLILDENSSLYPIMQIQCKEALEKIGYKFNEGGYIDTPFDRPTLTPEREICFESRWSFMYGNNHTEIIKTLKPFVEYNFIELFYQYDKLYEEQLKR